MIPCAGPSITQLEIDAATEAMKNGWYSNGSKYIKELEEEFAKYIGMKYALTTINCTAAIHLGLKLLGVKEGDEVIVPDITWIASAAPITYLGAKPIFVDIDRYNWCMSPESFENAITKKTKAIVLVDIYGNVPDMDKLVGIARDHDIPVLEDACESLGANYRNMKAGCFGDISTFSFSATKLITAGQGGMFVTNNKEYADKCSQLKHQGMVSYEVKKFWSEDLGFNYDYSNPQAAVVLTQLRRIEELLKFKANSYRLYKKNLERLSLYLNPELPDRRNVHWMVNAIFTGENKLMKEELMQRLYEKGIDTRPFFYPLSSMPCFKPYVKGKDMAKLNPVSYEISPYGVCLPSSFKLTEEDIIYTSKCLKEILNE